MDDEPDLARVTARFPPAEITPAQFEEVVVELLRSAEPRTQAFEVQLHEKVQGIDGVYDFDATVRFRLAGMAFLVIVEAKHHAHPIKRELVQVLHAKQQSVGAQKAIMISTSPYQTGALAHARVHGIALATLTEGRFTYETRSREARPVVGRQQARDLLGLPDFVAHLYGAGDSPGSTNVRLLSTDSPGDAAAALFGDLLEASAA